MIIGLSGFAGAGKDESARHLVLNHGFVRVAFADKLKEFALRLNPWLRQEGNEFLREHEFINLYSLVQIHGWDVAKQVPEVRKFLQDLGNEARNVLGDAVWLEAVEQTILSSRNVVITDMRYLNEIEFIASLGGWLVRIDRPGVTAPNNHVSEREWNVVEFDAVINNAGTVEDLARMLDEMLASAQTAEALRKW